MLKVTVQKQVLKVLQIISRHGQKSNWQQIIEWLTLISQKKLKKYLSITELLPDTFNPSTGCHNHCYKNFTVIQKPKKNTNKVPSK